jgi:hypothetical protein
MNSAPGAFSEPSIPCLTTRESLRTCRRNRSGRCRGAACLQKADRDGPAAPETRERRIQFESDGRHAQPLPAGRGSGTPGGIRPTAAAVFRHTIPPSEDRAGRDAVNAFAGCHTHSKCQSTSRPRKRNSRALKRGPGKTSARYVSNGARRPL